MVILGYFKVRIPFALYCPFEPNTNPTFVECTSYEVHESFEVVYFSMGFLTIEFKQITFEVMSRCSYSLFLYSDK